MKPNKKMSAKKIRKTRDQLRSITRFAIEALEPRMVLSHNGDTLSNWIMPADVEQQIAAQLAAEGTTTLAAAGTTSSNPFTPFTYNLSSNGMPVLNSLPGAPANIFLDFDGDTTTTTDPYTEDGDGTTFNATEQANIVEAWRQVSIYYAMFNVNVTTVQPDVTVVPTAWIAIGNNISNAYSGVGVFPNTDGSAESWSQSSYARTRISALTHELGHNFGNWHTSNYDNMGVKTAEYHSQFDPLHGPIMGIDYDGLIHKWTTWHSSIDAATLQDDMSFMAGDLGPLAPTGSQARDGYRVDDVGGTIATATPLFTNGSTQSIVGIVERLDDADMFSFVATTGNYNISVGRDNPSGIDTKVTVYDAAGNMLASEDGDPRNIPYTMVNDSQVSLSLGAGTYYVKVEGHGNYGDQGQYIVRVDPLATAWQATDIGLTGTAGYSSYDSANTSYTVAGSGDDIWNSADSFQYMYQTLTGDGSITAKITLNQNTNANAKAGVMIRESLDPSSRQATLIQTPNGTTYFQRRTSTGGSSSSTTGASSAWVRLVRVGTTISGFTSSNGTTWTFLGSMTLSAGSPVYIGLATSSHNNLKINTATYNNVSLTGVLNSPAFTTNSKLTTPTSLAITSTTSGAVNLSWSPSRIVGDTNNDGIVNLVDYVNVKNNFGATSGPADVNGDGVVNLNDYVVIKNNFGALPLSSYIVERSLDGINYSQAGTTAAGVTTFTDSGIDLTGGLRDAQRYFYRVRASNSSGASLASQFTTGITRAGAIGNLNIISYSSTQLVVDWTDASGETGYKLQRSINGVDGWSTVATLGRNVPMYTNGGLASGTQYFYRVITTDALGDSVTSAVASGWTRLAAPTGLQFTTKASTQMAISWTAVTGATGYIVERSNDNVTWTTLASNQSATSYTDNAVTQLNEYYYRVTAINSTNNSTPSSVIFAASPSSTALPSPLNSIELGSPAGTGAAGLNGSVLTVIGGGADIWGNSDQFRFTYVSMSGNGSITAQVVSLENTNYYARAGVMIRNTNTSQTSTAAGSRFVDVMVHQSTGSTRTQYRTSTNGGVGETTLPTDAEAPYWVRLTRTGNTFLSEVSPDGTTWTQLDSRNVTMNNTVFVGLAITPRDNNFLNKALFDHITIKKSDGTIIFTSNPTAGAASLSASSSTNTSSPLVLTAARSLLTASTIATCSPVTTSTSPQHILDSALADVWINFELRPAVVQPANSSLQQQPQPERKSLATSTKEHLHDFFASLDKWI